MFAELLQLGTKVWMVSAGSLLTALLIIVTRKHHLRWTAKGHAGTAIQSAHDTPTPRIGGLAVMVGLVLAALLLGSEASGIMAILIVSSLPVFFAGLGEDIGFDISPRIRLAMAGISSILMIVLTGQSITHAGIVGIDWLLALPAISFAFTVFATAGVAHAFNLVDGLNGLSKAITMSVGAAYAVIALQVGDVALAALAVALVCVSLGVFAVNYPLGRVFLGDAGAYTLGHITAWIAVLLMARHPEISPWAVLLAAFWPVMDTAAAILRRWRKALPAGEPDRMHFHHVVLRLLRGTLRGPRGRAFANPLATAALAPLFLLPPLLSVLTALNGPLALAAFLFCAALYILVRGSLVRNFRKIIRLRRSGGSDHTSSPEVVGPAE